MGDLSSSGVRRAVEAPRQVMSFARLQITSTMASCFVRWESQLAFALSSSRAGGDTGAFAKASMVATYTNDRHVVGTARFDVGLACIMCSTSTRSCFDRSLRSK